MSQEPTLKDIFETLVELRKEFNDYRASASKRGGASGGGGASSGNGEVPQPEKLVAAPGEVQVHFGKNAGKPIDELSERSLSWYAQDPEPRLDSSGKPFPPRDADVALRQACRQLWHLRKGTLKGVSDQIAAAPKAATKHPLRMQSRKPSTPKT